MPKPLIMTEEQLRESLKAQKPAPEGQLRKAFVAEVKAMDDERALDFVISTDAVDRMGDTIAVDGWNLANYRKNPVVLWAHDNYMHPIAKASNIRVEDGKLKARAHFVAAEVPHIGPVADCTLQLLKGGFLSAVSVGFIPVKYAFSEEDGRTWGIDFLEQELLEFSVCPIPANPEALIEGRSAGIDIAPIKEWATKWLTGEGLSVIGTDRLAAIGALPEEFRAAAKKVPASVKGARGLWLRCANLAEKAIKGDDAEPQTETDEPATPAPTTTATTAETATAPETPRLEMARRRLALLG